MALNNTPISISPLDINKNVAIGVVFPLMSDGIFQKSFTIKEQIKTNIINVLLTEKGERVNMPNFGCGLKAKLFENNPAADEIKDLINFQLREHVPQIDVQEVEVDFIEDKHLLFIKLIYSFNLNGEIDSIQININQQQNSFGKNG